VDTAESESEAFTEMKPFEEPAPGETEFKPFSLHLFPDEVGMPKTVEASAPSKSQDDTRDTEFDDGIVEDMDMDLRFEGRSVPYVVAFEDATIGDQSTVTMIKTAPDAPKYSHRLDNHMMAVLDYMQPCALDATGSTTRVMALDGGREIDLMDEEATMATLETLETYLKQSKALGTAGDDGMMRRPGT
jgi:hypothetical protein